MAWYGHAFNYKLVGRSSNVDDPVIEFLSQGIVGGPIKGVTREFRVVEYFAMPFTLQEAHPVLGIAGGGGDLLKPHILAFYRWLLSNPFTIAGDCDLALIVKRGFQPGPEVFPASEYAMVLENPKGSAMVCEVLYPGVAGVCVKATRRGMDLLTSLAKSILGLQLLSSASREDLLKATLLSVLEAMLVKSLQIQSRDIDVVSSYTTAYMVPTSLVIIAKRYMDILKRRAGDVEYMLSQLLGNSNFMEYVLGELVPSSNVATAMYETFMQRLRDNLDKLVDRLAEFVRKDAEIEAVIADITGKWSLLDLYVSLRLAKKLGVQQIYLLTTPEAHINLVSVYLLLIDAKNRGMNVCINISNDLALETEGIKVTPIASSATDPHIVKAVVTHLIEEHGERVVHLMGHPALASAITLKLYHDKGLHIENVLTYPLSRYFNQ